MNSQQSFYRGETVFIECDSYPGEPPQTLKWSKYVEGQTTSITPDGNHMMIAEIEDSDSGLYECGYNKTLVNISVSVVDPPADPLNPMVPPYVIIRYNESEPLDLVCRPRQFHPNTFWITRTDGGHLIRGDTLYIPHDQVLPGVYGCILGNGNKVYPVFVSVIQTPPVIEKEEWETTSTELEPLILQMTFRYSLENSNLSLQWQQLGGYGAISFASRINYTTTGQKLAITIREAQLDDIGVYSLNVTNQYGSTVLTVRLNVVELSRTCVEVTFQNLLCDTIQVKY